MNPTKLTVPAENIIDDLGEQKRLMYPSTKCEIFSVPVGRLTDTQMDYCARRAARRAVDIYAEDPGVYPSFDMFLGCRIGAESIHYVYQFGGRKEMERFATAVMRHVAEYRPIPLPPRPPEPVSLGDSIKWDSACYSARWLEEHNSNPPPFNDYTEQPSHEVMRRQPSAEEIEEGRRIEAEEADQEVRNDEMREEMRAELAEQEGVFDDGRDDDFDDDDFDDEDDDEFADDFDDDDDDDDRPGTYTYIPRPREG